MLSFLLGKKWAWGRGYSARARASKSKHGWVMSSVREGPSDELLAGWSTELEAVLYSPEVEEAINEVPTYLLMRLH